MEGRPGRGLCAKIRPQMAKEDSAAWDKAVKLFIVQAKPLIESYKAQMELRGVLVHALVLPTFFQFKVMYGEGERHIGFEFAREPPNSGYEFFSLHTNREGVPHRGRKGAIGIDQTCSIAALEARIQQCISDATIYAEANRSVSIQPSAPGAGKPRLDGERQ
jgi:hypothetical protein